MTSRIWYVSYGSNLLRARFLTYLTGGVPPGGTRTQRGARDKTPPMEDRRVDLPHALYFAGDRSRQWGEGGVAFVTDAASEPRSIGRAYLITSSQFDDVMMQENKWDEPRKLPDEALVPGARVPVGDGLYGLALGLAQIDGLPAVTFTAPPPGHAPESPPSRSYLRTICAGLRELSVSREELVAYLLGARGVAGHLDARAILTAAKSIAED